MSQFVAWGVTNRIQQLVTCPKYRYLGSKYLGNMGGGPKRRGNQREWDPKGRGTQREGNPKGRGTQKEGGPKGRGTYLPILYIPMHVSNRDFMMQNF